MLAGTVISSVGERPRQSVVTPSLRAIFLSPSIVELMVLLWASSTAQSTAGPEAAAVGDRDPALWATRQYSTLLVEKKTSRQQAVTPRFAGPAFERVFVVRASLEKSIFGGWTTDCDCSRTRTTSRGVTAGFGG